MPRVEEVYQSMTEARQTIAVIIIFRKPSKNSLKRQAGGYRSSRFEMPYFYVKEVSYFLKKTIHLFVGI